MTILNVLSAKLNIYIYNTPLSYIKMEFQKLVNFLNTNPDENLPRFVTKKWIEVYDQSEEITRLIKKLESKHQC